jgi:hypothetical protein
MSPVISPVATDGVLLSSLSVEQLAESNANVIALKINFFIV